jgi:hypothetical protein
MIGEVFTYILPLHKELNMKAALGDTPKQDAPFVP